MQPQTFAEVMFEQPRTPTRLDRFLDEMNPVVSWTELAAAMASVYLEAVGHGVRRWAAPPLSAKMVQPLGVGGAARLAGHPAVRGH